MLRIYLSITPRGGEADGVVMHYSLASPLAAFVSGHTLEVTGGAGI